MATFNLQVTFTGLNLFLVHADQRQVAVLQPDARKSNKTKHPDGTKGIPHVGYVSFDLAQLDLPQGAQPFVGGEAVYQFRGQEILDFGVPPSGPTDRMTGQAELPQIERIANESDGSGGFVSLLEPAPRLFSTNSATPPPKSLLMRARLDCGNLSANPMEHWRFSRLFRRDRDDEYEQPFKSDVTWTRKVVTTASGLVMKIAKFDGTDERQIPLKPGPGNVLKVKVANLCGVNPLEWEELEDRRVTADDEDFKWIYHLLRVTRNRKYEKILLDCPLPVPQKPKNGNAGVEDCFGASLSVKQF